MAAVTKFSYLNDLVNPKVKTAIAGLPFTTETIITRLNTSLSRNIVNTRVQNSMELPVITGSLPKKIHKFYQKLIFNMKSLETLGNLKDISGYVRMFIDKLQGIRGNLVRKEYNWREWDFPNFVRALRKWTERNPVEHKLTEKPADQKMRPLFLATDHFKPCR